MSQGGQAVDPIKPLSSHTARAFQRALHHPMTVSAVALRQTIQHTTRTNPKPGRELNGTQIQPEEAPPHSYFSINVHQRLWQ